MGCDFPIKAYRTDQVLPSGKRAITFNPLRGLNSSSPFLLPCNNCVGCRLERSRQWAVRMTHEAKMHSQNSFITLTYDNQHVPESFGLDLRHWQLFMKKLRRRTNHRIRFFGCGEYGDQNLRPHYHAILFGHDFDDKKLWKTNGRGDPIFQSAFLTDVWSMGFATTQLVVPESTAYVARYSVKKLAGEARAEKYYRISPVDGAYHSIRVEFGVMSKRPGIGHTFFDKFRSDLFPSGTVVINGRVQAIPRYYLNRLTEEERQFIQRNQRLKSLPFKEHQTTERRWARVAVRDARISNLKRTL
ncbi:replication initiator protein [robinz microvirus RP_75]|nr:replication initiator protein [robinz microvirus RP_75]